MRHIWKVLLVTLIGTACTPAEAREWWSVYQKHPQGAVRFARCVTARPKAWAHPGGQRAICRRLGREAQLRYNAEHAQWVPDTACSQWAQAALDVGWSKDQWYEPIARIMYAESRCDPGAYNPNSGVAGLMQIHPLWWNAGEGGCTGDRYNPWVNLRCARHVYHEQGWDAWVTY